MLIAMVLCAGCGSGGDNTSAGNSFVLAWSEYPSWSVFGVAEKMGLIDGAAGKHGTVEDKYGIDIVLKQLDYDPCLAAYANKQVDAVCITNMDALIPAEEIPSVAILPTSTSNGADACISVGIDSIEALKEYEVFGLEKTVSEYCFVRNLEERGLSPTDYKFSNKDPGAAAQAMQLKDPSTHAIMVWNPFVLQTLKERSDAEVLFDSSTIPGEIIDMVVVSKEALHRPGGEKFAHAVIEAFYAVNDAIADPGTGDETLVAIGEKFSNLGLEDMKKVVKQTEFYKNPGEALELFSGDMLPAVMKKVVAFCVKYSVVEYQPNVAYGAQTSEAHLVFDPTYIKAVQSQ